jgi:DNA-nicking Smr family endonuclease
LTKQPPRRGKGPETFRDYVGDVRPLTSPAGRVPPAASRETRASSRTHATPVFDVTDDGQNVEGVRRGFEDVLADLRRGRFPIHATVDLHGLDSEQARKTLLAFCKSATGLARRVVLVIHGKGTHSAGGRGVLRDEIADWLSSAPLAERVLCFATARARHGGAGAVYVLMTPWR